MKLQLELQKTPCLMGSLLVLLVSTQACGSKNGNSNIPKPASEISISDVQDDSFFKINERWKNLLGELKLKNDGDELSLKTPSRYFESTVEGRTSYEQLTTTLSAEHLKTANRSSCAAIVDLQDLGNAKSIELPQPLLKDLSTARWYLMKYRRNLADGTIDPNVYGAIVSVPEASGSYPVIAYAHAGDQGLKLLELAAVFSQKQSQMMIVAPAFPGEAIFDAALFGGQQIFAAVGSSEPYSTDAEDLLAAHNCLLQSPSALSSLSTIRNKLMTRATGQVVSGTVGVSRGGMASLIALAKNASLMLNGRPETQYFSCAATAINPTSLVYDEFRIYLEAAIRGTAEYTSFFTLPTAPQLNSFLKDYREGKEGVTAARTALDIQMRDSTFNAGLILSTLRNWTTSGRGSLLMMHATLDEKIPFSQALIGGQVFSDINQSLTNAPGVHFTARGFAPLPDDSSDGKTLNNPAADMHGDLVWFRSRARLNSAQVNTNNWQASELSASDFGFDLQPLSVLWNWLDNADFGCASTYD